MSCIEKAVTARRLHGKIVFKSCHVLAHGLMGLYAGLHFCRQIACKRIIQKVSIAVYPVFQNRIPLSSEEKEEEKTISGTKANVLHTTAVFAHHFLLINLLIAAVLTHASPPAHSL